MGSISRLDKSTDRLNDAANAACFTVSKIRTAIRSGLDPKKALPSRLQSTYDLALPFFADENPALARLSRLDPSVITTILHHYYSDSLPDKYVYTVMVLIELSPTWKKLSHIVKEAVEQLEGDFAEYESSGLFADLHSKIPANDSGRWMD